MYIILTRKRGKRKQIRSRNLALSSGSKENLQKVSTQPQAENQNVEQKLQSSTTKEKAFAGQAINENIHPQARCPDDWSHLMPDERGAELGREARVWKVYVGEADRWDREVVEGWEKSMDVLLVFAALFSAISATFLVETSSMLKQDPNDVSAERLLAILQTLRTIAAGNSSANPTTLPQPWPANDTATSFAPPQFAVIVNGLWYTSLSLSIASAFLAMLAKDWCYSFSAGRTGHPQDQAHRRQRKWKLIERCKMEELIKMLPPLMHLSLLLFSVGLCVYLWNLNSTIAIPVTCIAGIFLAFYIWSSIIASVVDYFPYTTIISEILRSKYMRNFYRVITPFLAFVAWIIGVLFLVVSYCYTVPAAIASVAISIPVFSILLLDSCSLQWFAKPGSDTSNLWKRCIYNIYGLLAAVYGSILLAGYHTLCFIIRKVESLELTDDLTTSLAVSWIIENCETSSAVDIALQAIAGASQRISKKPLLASQATQQILRRIVSNQASDNEQSSHSRYIRGLEFLGADARPHSGDNQPRTKEDIQAMMRDLISKHESKIADLIQKGKFVPSKNNLEAMRIGNCASSDILRSLMGEAKDTTDILQLITELLSHHFSHKHEQLHPAAVQSLAYAAALHLSLSETPGFSPDLMDFCMKYCKKSILEGSSSEETQPTYNVETTVLFTMCVLFHGNRRGDKLTDTMETLSQLNTRTSDTILALTNAYTMSKTFQNNVIWIALSEILYNLSYYSLSNDTDDWKPLKHWCSCTFNPLLQWGVPSITRWFKFLEVFFKGSRDIFLTATSHIYALATIPWKADPISKHLPDSIFAIVTHIACSSSIEPQQSEICFELLSKNAFPRISEDLVASLRMRTSRFDDDETVLSSIGTMYINKMQPLSQLHFAAAQLWLLLYLARVPSSIHQTSLNEVIHSELGDSLQLQSKGSDQVRADLEVFIIENYRREFRNNRCVEEDKNIRPFIWGRIKGSISSWWVESNTQPSPFSIGRGLKLLEKSLRSDLKLRSKEKNRTVYMARIVEYILKTRGLQGNEDLVPLLEEDLKDVSPGLRRFQPEVIPLPLSRATSRTPARTEVALEHGADAGHVSIDVHGISSLWEDDSDWGLENLFNDWSDAA